MTALATAVLPAAEPYAPTRYEAFNLGIRTYLLDPLKAKSLDDAINETTDRWGWDRGDRMAIREIGEECDRLYIYAVRKKSIGNRTWDGHTPVTKHDRWLDPICTIDLDTIAGIARKAVGWEVQMHDRVQAERPGGARFTRSNDSPGGRARPITAPDILR